MTEVPETMFDVFALALPSGLAFGEDLPVGAWASDDGSTCAALTRSTTTGIYGCLVMRRRVDDVWVVLKREASIGGEKEAGDVLRPFLEGRPPREPLPPGASRRPALGDTSESKASNIFKSLAQPPRHVGAWMLNQLYLAMPNPDRNWAADCQTENFHTRLWEAHLNACFREQGLRVTQDHASPDFRISNRNGEAWVEAVTTNPPERYDHYGAKPSQAPSDSRERVIGSAAVRFAKTIRSKLQKGYDALPHVEGKPFAVAIADFHAPGSMMWSREALPSYLYGMYAKVVEEKGERIAVAEEIKTLLGEEGIPAGLFSSDEHAEISAIIYSSGCTIAKLSRVGISAGAGDKKYRYIRMGEYYDRTPGALKGIPFVMDVASPEYVGLWHPYSYEPWSAEMEVFHNPYARHPIPDALLPEATHWRKVNGEVICRAFYPYSILYSTTRVQPIVDPVPTIEEILKAGLTKSEE